jgi:hypothetical protein
VIEETDPSSVIRPATAELVIIFVTVLIASLGYNYGGPLNETTNMLVPLMLIVGQVFGILSLISRSYNNIWSPLLWTRVAAIFYLGIGSLVPGFVNDATLGIIEGFYYFFPDDVAKYNLVNAIFIFVLLIVTRLILSSAHRMFRLFRGDL